MYKEWIPGPDGSGIPSINWGIGDGQLTVILTHGFGSSKESPTNRLVAAALLKKGIGAWSFDLPAHGESPLDGSQLRLERCLGDMAAVEAHIHSLYPQSELAYFSSSFGAYLNLLHLGMGGRAGRRSFLRCAAVNMCGILRRGITPALQTRLNRDGFVLLEDGYARPLKVTRAFLKDLDAHDVFRLYCPGTAQLAMIHGTADMTAPLEEACRFADLAGASLIRVEGADHRFLTPPGADRLVADAAVAFFTAP
ncbi:hypothetical protein SDC9_85893 [bioreactor metagenome]|uniref:Serine aminopeptidase S33 domain-containing protein n=1 Tax=bioreactor metagenome TaxID=1076179 RepID=A0A644ZEG0_9ZZZZ